MENKLMQCLRRAAEAALCAAKPHDGFVPSLLSRDTGEMLTELPPCLPGQRVHDRAHPGSNLMHDHFLLRFWYAFSGMTGDARYAVAADRYLRAFTERCTRSPTGLFPWGEHAFWHLCEGRPSSGQALKHDAGEAPPPLVHDHLHQAPRWLWEKLWEFRPGAVLRFCNGLRRHYKTLTPPEYNRHAFIDSFAPYDPGGTCHDFPRHGGFYLYDWAFACQKTGDAGLKGEITRMLDYQRARADENGLLPYRTREPRITMGVSQTLSLGACLLEAAELMGETDAGLKGRLLTEGARYASAFLAAPHDAKRGVFALGCTPAPYASADTMPLWSSAYGRPSAASAGCILGCCYRLCGDAGLLDTSLEMGRCYRETPFPAHLPGIPAADAGLVIGLFCELFELSCNPAWLDAATETAEAAADAFFDLPLPRAATGAEHYESQMLPGLLMYNMLRVLSLQRGTPMPGEYAYRQ